MPPLTLQFLIAMIASAISERPQRKLDYGLEEVRVLKEILCAATGKYRTIASGHHRRQRNRAQALNSFASATALKP